MENMLHSTPLHMTVPSSYVLTPDQLKHATSASGVSLPVIDLSGSHGNVCCAILDAGKEFGFFQVVNHGVPEKVIQDMEDVCKEFFRLPATDKADLYSEDITKPTRIFSSSMLETGGVKYWRDCLRLASTFPVGDNAKDWPEKPHRLREVIEKFIVPTRGMGMELLRLLSEGMGIQADYFEGDISGGDVSLDVNHYPVCPDPSMTLGLPPHCDRVLITLLFPSMVPGLEVLYKGEWIKVEPIPNAFVINFGCQLEVVTNGMLKSIEHRVTTNSAMARTSIVTSIMPTPDCLIGPAEEFTSEDNPPNYRALTYGDFKRIYNVVNLRSSLNHTTNFRNTEKQM